MKVLPFPQRLAQDQRCPIIRVTDYSLYESYKLVPGSLVIVVPLANKEDWTDGDLLGVQCKSYVLLASCWRVGADLIQARAGSHSLSLAHSQIIGKALCQIEQEDLLPFLNNEKAASL
jgi:hypothetical protein